MCIQTFKQGQIECILGAFWNFIPRLNIPYFLWVVCILQWISLHWMFWRGHFCECRRNNHQCFFPARNIHICMKQSQDSNWSINCSTKSLHVMPLTSRGQHETRISTELSSNSLILDVLIQDLYCMLVHAVSALGQTWPPHREKFRFSDVFRFSDAMALIFSFFLYFSLPMKI